MRERGVPAVLLPLASILALAWLAWAAPAFRRADWMPRGWIDADGNCRDTRQEVLVRDSRSPVLWRENEREHHRCEVAWGEWRDPWSGEVMNDPGRVDVDHHVPLAEAHRSGGGTWTPARREAYANDLDFRWHLRAVSARINRQKGDRGPDRWRPPDRTSWCRYALEWSAVKTVWRLQTTEQERVALREMLRSCEETPPPVPAAEPGP
jgi:hypothetical protein